MGISTLNKAHKEIEEFPVYPGHALLIALFVFDAFLSLSGSVKNN